MSAEPRRGQEEEGVVDGAAEAAEDIADEFLDLDGTRDPSPGPPRTIKDEK